MDDHVKLLPDKLNRSQSPRYSRKFIFLLYFCVLAIVVYITITIEWNSIGRHINFYSDSRLRNLIDERIIKVLKTEGLIQQNNTLSTVEFKSTTPQQIVEKTYRLDTKSCKISDLPLFDAETRPLFKNITETIWECSHKRLVKIKRFDETSLRFNWTEVGYKPYCYYRNLSRGKNDFDFIYDEFIGPLNETTLHLPDYNFVHIVCFKNTLEDWDPKHIIFNRTDPELIHNEIIPLIPLIKKTSTSDVPNVLLIAIDATSYVNFKRHFLRTEKLLNKQKFFELKGYNKVGANTYPNMVPFMTGHHSIELVADDKLHDIYFDDWPLIWKKYSEKGFITTFMEEMSWCGLFHFNLWGFLNKPTDYQTRAFHQQIMKEKYNYYCYLDRTETEACLDWTYEYVKAMNKRNQKYWAYISVSEMTHDWIEAGHYLDVPYHQLFTKLFDEKLLENTLLIFFSDHGFRYGALRQTHTGEVENRLPFIFIHLPENFNSEYAENLIQNQNRLTTPFDIHATLTHLIEGKPDYSLPHGLSLFDKVISDERDCNGSSIPDMFCSCHEDVELQDFDIIKPETTVQTIVTKINSFTSGVRHKCSEYTFHSIHKLYNRSLSKADKEYDLGDSQIFIIQIYVTPGMALFETVLRSFDNNTRFEVVGEITRINLYGNQAHCLNDKLLNNYCFCKDLLKN